MSDRREGPPGEAPNRGSAGALGGLGRATAWMAAGTGLSRVSGLLRVLVLAYALGATHLSTSFNLANTTPNMIYDIVLGGVLSATFIPVFVDRLATRGEKDGWRAISAVATLSAVVLVAMTLVFLVAAPQVVDAFTAFDHATGVSRHALATERGVAVDLLRWFVPQVALYGFIALLTALLNTRRRFVAPMWVPIANNVVCIAVLLWFHHLTQTPSLAAVRHHPGWVVLLGLGTTLGVVLQAVLLVISARGAGLGRLRWRWEPGHEAVRTVGRLGGWTLGFVVANQVTLFVVLALAVGASGPDPVSSYTYAYTFMQMPYAVVAVSVMSAVTPGLSERWATGDTEGFANRLWVGLRTVLSVIVPAAMGMFLLAKPAADLLFAHGPYSVADASGTGATLAMFSLGLPGFCTYLYVVRALQSMQRTKVAFWLYLVENGINVVLAIALVGPLGVRGLALSLSVAYTLGAVAGLVVLRGWLGGLGDARTWAPLRRGLVATVVMGAVVLVVSNLSGAERGVLLLGRVLGSVAVGGLVYVGVSYLLGRRAERSGAPTPGGERRLVARAGPDRTRAIGYEGGMAYESGMGPGTGMVPIVAPWNPRRSGAGTSGLGPIRRGGSGRVLGPSRPARPPRSSQPPPPGPGLRRVGGNRPPPESGSGSGSGSAPGSGSGSGALPYDADDPEGPEGPGAPG